MYSGREHLERRLDRYRQFYSRRGPGALRIVAGFPDGHRGEPVDLRTFDFSAMAEHRRYWDVLADRTHHEVVRRAEVDDDWVPGVVLSYGFGAFGAVYCDVPLVFTENTSYMSHALTGWNEWESAGYAPDRFWSRVFIEAGRHLRGASRDAFLVDPYPNPSPLDVANLIMGNELFTAIGEDPARLCRLLDRLTGEVIRNAESVQAGLSGPHGGTLTFNAWIPQGILVLEDAADLCSPETYRRFGRPYTSRIISAFGGGYIHHHNLGRHQYSTMASIPDLTVLQISSDPNQPRTAEHLCDLLAQVGNVPVDIEVTPDEIRRYIDELHAGRFILRTGCSSKEEARDLVALVRDRSRY